MKLISYRPKLAVHHPNAARQPPTPMTMTGTAVVEEE